MLAGFGSISFSCHQPEPRALCLEYAMDAKQQKYFDYLPRYGDRLQALIGRPDLVDVIDFCRDNGYARPDVVAVDCRRILEAAIAALIGKDDSIWEERPNLHEMIDYAEDCGLIDHSLFLKANEIRRIGNDGAHRSVAVINAEMSMELLDDVLRYLLVFWEIAPEDIRDIPRIQGDSVFRVIAKEQVASISHKARTAALLGDNTAIEKEALRTLSDVMKEQDQAAVLQAQLRKLALQAKELETSVQEKLIEEADTTAKAVGRVAECAASKIAGVNKAIDEVLNEHDYIRMLLAGKGRATDAQFDVMAFPRGSRSTTNILQIAGAAGTGKTLCLLAKLIKDTDDDGQLGLLEDGSKKALFICFNKNLAGYVRRLMENYPQAESRIEIVTFDEYVNQLVRATPKRGYEHLAAYASDVRYPVIKDSKASVSYMKLIYQNDSLPRIAEAMEQTALAHPDLRAEYYLDCATAANVAWVDDEVRWLEARYEDEREAAKHYLTAVRTGRGTSRRPNANVRRVILEVWKRFRALLRKHNEYTIEQATKRLLKSRSLPSYNAIAVDEVQDFSILSIKLLVKLRAPGKARMYLSGDENQKIYQRDFSWRELQADLRGYTITLKENKRNSAAIDAFSRRLVGGTSSHEEACRNIWIDMWPDEKIRGLIDNLSSQYPNETNAIIGAKKSLHQILRGREGSVEFVGAMASKGLEYDNVVVDYAGFVSDDVEQEKNLRYVHFTRARKRLYIRYQGEPPLLLKEFYGDFLQEGRH